MESRVKWFNDIKGYGFIDNNQLDDIFVHYSQVNKEGYKSLNSGDIVQFDLITTDKGYQARNVSLISSDILTG
ncbi:MAG: cold shock domain-containing protein [Bacilli bacterium]|nr:cold shock domain-containing protein [Bacilli bacterium]